MDNLLPLIPMGYFNEGRAKEVTPFERFSAFLFGSPCFGFAHGLGRPHFRKSSYRNRVKEEEMKTMPTGKEGNMPVYRFDRRGTLYAEKLPTVWLTEVLGDEGRRSFVRCYPCGSDDGGVRALEYAQIYLDECAELTGYFASEQDGAESRSMIPDGTIEAADRPYCGVALECLKAAELLLLHSAVRGNPLAYLKLGWMYFEDVCAGEYFRTFLEERAGHARELSGNALMGRALFCFEEAIRILETPTEGFGEDGMVYLREAIRGRARVLECLGLHPESEQPDREGSVPSARMPMGASASKGDREEKEPPIGLKRA